VGELLIKGLHPVNIAARMGIGEGTVKIHLRHMYQKRGIDSGNKMIKLAVALYYEWAREVAA
jgi:DNA-binding CsgD family transcriptional regulator